MHFDGEDVRYVVYVPPCYDPAQPIPTILFLHGKGEYGTDGLRQIQIGLSSAVMADIERWPFLIVFPQKRELESEWLDDDRMVTAVLDEVRRDYSVDPSRLYLTGLSRGGHGAWALGAKHADLFAAVAPICGRAAMGAAEKLVGMPVWVFHGEADEVVPVEETYTMVKYLEEAGGSCRVTIYPGVNHNSWDKAYREENLPEWFLGHSSQDC